METSRLFQQCLRQTLNRPAQCKKAASYPRQLHNAFPTKRKDGRHYFSTSSRTSQTTQRTENRSSSATNSDSDASRQPQPSKAAGLSSNRKPFMDLLGLVNTSAASASGTSRIRNPSTSSDPLDAFGPAPLQPGQKRTPIDRNQLYLDIMSEPTASSFPSLFSSTTDTDRGPTLKLNPKLGRSVELKGVMDLTRALRQLEFKCNANSVKAESIKQRTYVRRGQRRKADKRKRWRALFKAGFMEECARIRRMRAQGW